MEQIKLSEGQKGVRYFLATVTIYSSGICG